MEARDELLTESLSDEHAGFIVDDDGKAMWVLERVKEAEIEANSIISHCERQIQIAKDKLVQRKAFWVSKLEPYFDSVPKHTTKTQQSYKLPNGSLVRKAGGVVYTPQSDVLCAYLKRSGLSEFVKVEETPKWGEYKKRVLTNGDILIDSETGEVVQGVEVTRGQPAFIIKTEGV